MGCGLMLGPVAKVLPAEEFIRVAPHFGALAFRRAIHVPARGIGQATMEILDHEAERLGVSLPEAARRLPDALANRARIALERFFALIEDLRNASAIAAPGDLVRTLLERSGLAEQYATDDEEDRSRRANLEELIAAAAEAGERGLDLPGFMDEVALLTGTDVETSKQAVQLSTLHAAKGLEFDIVFLVGLEDGLLPLKRNNDAGEIEDEEEERRLAYVGMTRARKRLYLTLARTRRLHGQSMAARPSPFLREVPREFVEDRTPSFGRDAFRLTAPHPHAHAGARWETRQRVPAPATGEAGDSGQRTGDRASKHPDGWHPGLKVRHATFGSGVILQVQGVGAQTRIIVFFDRAGRKTLIPSLAHLERL